MPLEFCDAAGCVLESLLLLSVTDIAEDILLESQERSSAVFLSVGILLDDLDLL